MKNENNKGKFNQPKFFFAEHNRFLFFLTEAFFVIIM